MKKKIIFCAKNLDIGGIERAVISLLIFVEERRHLSRFYK